MYFDPLTNLFKGELMSETNGSGIAGALEALNTIGNLTVEDIDKQIANKNGEIAQLKTLRKIAAAKTPKTRAKRKKKEAVAAE